ncbi:hypothetical protein ACOSQ4_004794 [Xanthoceras sorbifolium]
MGVLFKLFALGTPHPKKPFSSPHSHISRRTATSAPSRHCSSSPRHCPSSPSRCSSSRHITHLATAHLRLSVAVSSLLLLFVSSSPRRLFVFHLCGGDLRVRGGAATAGDGAEDGAKDI